MSFLPLFTVPYIPKNIWQPVGVEKLEVS
uniref:Uncharacterized protein n=1 Tax=Arundo donax TaxID=35708 RepID=A0A0A9EXF5_ARUDO